MPTDAYGRPSNQLQLLSRVMGLAMACPYSQDNPERCQLCEVRSLAMASRIEWVRGLSSSELNRISTSHDACLKALEALSGIGDGPR